MKTQTSNRASGNWVAFLFGAFINVIVNIAYQGLTEFAFCLLIGSVISGGVFFLYKIISDRI